MTLTRALADAAAKDAASRNMRENGRSAWNEDDFNVAVREFDRLWPLERDLKPEANGDPIGLG